MRKTTKLYRDVEQIMNSMGDVETEFRVSPTIKSRRQLSRCLDRIHILGEELKGMLG